MLSRAQLNRFFQYAVSLTADPASAEDLLQVSLEKLLGKGVLSSVNDAYKMALSKATIDDFIFIGGSTFVVAEVL